MEVWKYFITDTDSLTLYHKLPTVNCQLQTPHCAGQAVNPALRGASREPSTIIFQTVFQPPCYLFRIMPVFQTVNFFCQRFRGFSRREIDMGLKENSPVII